jgi:hypothetical protein
MAGREKTESDQSKAVRATAKGESEKEEERSHSSDRRSRWNDAARRGGQALDDKQ